MANELKPCPFCGGRNLTTIWNNNRIWLECVDCDARTKSMYSPNVKENQGDSEAKAITAWNTRPDAPVEGLETIGYRYRHVDYVNWTYSETKYPRPDIHNEELVTRSQADVIIAAKDAKIADLENELSSFRSSFKEQTSLKADNAALTARCAEWSKYYAEKCSEYEAQKRNTEALETQLAALKDTAKSVENWWLSEGMNHFPGAPYCIFAIRAALEGKP